MEANCRTLFSQPAAWAASKTLQRGLGCRINRAPHRRCPKKTRKLCLQFCLKQRCGARLIAVNNSRWIGIFRHTDAFNTTVGLNQLQPDPYPAARAHGDSNHLNAHLLTNSKMAIIAGHGQRNLILPSKCQAESAPSNQKVAAMTAWCINVRLLLPPQYTWPGVRPAAKEPSARPRYSVQAASNCGINSVGLVYSPRKIPSSALEGPAAQTKACRVKSKFSFCALIGLIGHRKVGFPIGVGCVW